MEEEAAQTVTPFRARHDLQTGGQAIRMTGLDEDVALPDRLKTGLAELDRALGGGIVAGSATLMAGDPGIGKSTLLLQAAARLAMAGQAVAYISGEESVQQFALRADRLGGGGWFRGFPRLRLPGLRQ